MFGNAKIAAVGETTATAIRDQLCLHVDLCPDSFVAEALAEALANRGQIAGKRFLLLRADIARPLLRERLEQAHAAEVRDIPIYQTRRVSALPPTVLEAIESRKVTWATFTSSSTAKNFAELLGLDYPSKLAGIKIASIGPITTQTLRELGLEPTVQADTFNIDGLVNAISSSKWSGGIGFP